MIDLMTDEQVEQLATAFATALAMCWFARHRRFRRPARRPRFVRLARRRQEAVAAG